MSYTVTITYEGVDTPVDKMGAPIAGFYCPRQSYIETPVYTQGYPIDADAADKEYGKSIYATNVPGFGSVDLPEPYATTSLPYPSPLAQFKLAAISEEQTVSFDVDDYKEAIYYIQLGKAVAEQGFVVEVSGIGDEDDNGDNGDNGGDTGNDEP